MPYAYFIKVGYLGGHGCSLSRHKTAINSVFEIKMLGAIGGHRFGYVYSLLSVYPHSSIALARV
jgi:hypothetical protein